MVRDQLAARGISHQGVLDAMARVPRHLFVPANVKRRAYEDRPLQIGNQQTISQPYMVARMTELLAPEPGDRILEIGTGSGYQAAVLSMLAGEIITVERHESLADKASARLEDAGCVNVHCVVGDGTRGWPEGAPYDGILVTAGAPTVPKALEAQLAIGGRLVCPVGTREEQQLVRLTRTDQGIKREQGLSCAFVPLIGEQGWQAPSNEDG
jgi:protein-L-isoaspartate(D-aspartate) O-methyltransferase